MSNSLLRALVDVRDRQIQKARIQFGNRLDALDRAADDAGPSNQRGIVRRWSERFIELEAELDRDIAATVCDEPIYEQLAMLKGVGPVLSAKLIAMIDIERADTVSSLWRYAGYAVIDGQRERPVKGEKLHYNQRLKTTVYLIAQSFLRCGSPYRQVYDAAKTRYETIRPDWTKMHRHLAALRKMSKRFLAHLWERWRLLEGLSIRGPYVEEYLQHRHIDQPEDYGWPEL